MDDIYNMSKKKEKFTCDVCYYHTSRKSNYRRHLATRSHLRRSNLLVSSNFKNIAPKGANLLETSKTSKKEYKCPKCDKKYKHSQSLWKHKKACGLKEVDLLKLEVQKLKEENKQEVQKLKEENKFLKEKAESAPSVINSTTNNNISINVFLNEHCKNAMNLTDFVNQIRITLDDLMKTRQSGYVDGIANIFIRNLRDLSDVERPIHCSDKKRLKF